MKLYAKSQGKNMCGAKKILNWLFSKLSRPAAPTPVSTTTTTPLALFDLYFLAPNAESPIHSALRLARRDAAQCFGYNPNTYIQGVSTVDFEAYPHPTALWPGAMTVFSACDQLSKYMAGTDVEMSDEVMKRRRINKGQRWRYNSSKRLTKYLTNYVAATGAEAGILFQLRNALMHSFALWSKQRGEDGFEYHFVLDGNLNATNLITWYQDQNGNRRCLVSLYLLHNAFEQGLSRFILKARQDIQNDAEYSSNVRKLIERYGFLEVNDIEAFGFSNM